MSTSLFLLVVLVLFGGAASFSGAADTDFIEKSCKNATSYPTLCIRSLSGHAGEIGSDPWTLARVALNVSLGAARSVDRLLNRAARIRGMTPDESASVGACVEMSSSAVEDLEMAVGEMGPVGGGPDFETRVGNVLTWAGSAMTEQDTCLDGFEDPPIDGRVKRLVTWRVVKVIHLASNGLAFVNEYASSIGALP